MGRVFGRERQTKPLPLSLLPVISGHSDYYCAWIFSPKYFPKYSANFMNKKYIIKNIFYMFRENPKLYENIWIKLKLNS